MRREFSRKVKAEAFERADGHCENCGAKLFTAKFHYDHIIPDALGGEPTIENCACVCTNCHGEKTAKQDVPRIAKTKRVRDKFIGAARKRSSLSHPYLRKRLDGQVVRKDAQ